MIVRLCWWGAEVGVDESGGVRRDWTASKV